MQRLSYFDVIPSRMRRILCFLLLTGCPPPPRYAVIQVHDPAPVGDALVAADCGQFRRAAMRTDDSGFARLPLGDEVPAEHCVVTVAKPGYHTAEVSGVQLCTSPACPPLMVELVSAVSFALPRPAPAPVLVAPAPRTYAAPPPEVLP
jgi:hypothetical protein